MSLVNTVMNLCLVWNFVICTYITSSIVRVVKSRRLVALGI